MSAEVEERVFPCEGCGTDVHIASNSDVANYWADGILVLLCHDCWAARDQGGDPQ